MGPASGNRAHGREIAVNRVPQVFDYPCLGGADRSKSTEHGVNPDEGCVEVVEIAPERF